MGTEDSQRRGRLYLEGEWRETDQSRTVRDLAAGDTFATVGVATPADARDALAAAARAESSLRTTSVVERARWCLEIASGIEARAETLAEVVVREAGKPISSARGEVAAAAERFRRAAEEARSIVSYGEFREGTTESHEGWNAIVKREPVGTVLAITPYNYPLATTALHVAPALAAGNAVVLKPASQTPVSASILAEIVDDVDGLPPGAFNFVSGPSGEIGDVLSGDDRVDCIAMTGSAPAGKHVARESGMVRLQLELGGNAPAIVFEDADLDEVVPGCVTGALKYGGQRCSAVSRILAHDPIHDDLVEALEAEMDAWHMGDLFETETALGPLIDDGQVEWGLELIDDALTRGGDLVRGGERRAPDGAPADVASQYLEPTLLANVPPDARIVGEEQFAPILAVTTFTDEEEALAIADDTALALDAAVFTSDYDRAFRVAEQVDAGAVRINGTPSHGLGDVPFGGNRDSGIGRAGIDATIHAMMRTKSIVL